MDEVLWMTFEEKAKDLLAYGFNLSYSLQVRAVNNIDQQLVAWKNRLHLPPTFTPCSCQSGNEDGKQFEVFQENGEVATPCTPLDEDQDWDTASPTSERKSHTTEHVHSSTVTDVCEDNKYELDLKLTDSSHCDSHTTSSEGRDSSNLRTGLASGGQCSNGYDVNTYTNDDFANDLHDKNSATDAHTTTVNKNNKSCLINDVIEGSVKIETCDVDAVTVDECNDYYSSENESNSNDSSPGNQGQAKHKDKQQRKSSTTQKRKTVDCEVCSETFDSRSNLKIHRRLHGKGPFACKVCEKMYETGQKLRQHLKIHSRETWKCDKCDKEYKTPGGLSMHKQTHNPTKQCPHCDHKSPNLSYLQIHIDRTHFKNDINRKRHVCHTCGERYYKKSLLNRHFITHTDVKNHVCPHCDHSTKSELLLRRHIKNMHTPSDPFVCNICGATTKFKESMEQHHRRHRNEKPFKCDQCSYAAVSSCSLSQHKLIHRPPTFECDVCGKKFVLRGHLKRHKVIHTGQKEFACSQCKYSCNVHSNLTKHIRKVHKL